MHARYRLVIDCPDQIGLVLAVSQFLVKQQATIVEASHHTDQQSQRFFMRHEFTLQDTAPSLVELEQSFADIAATYEMNWRFIDTQNKQRVALLASHESHCINDLLHRWQSKELDCEIVCVIANHQSMAKFADWYDLPFHHISFPVDNKAQSFLTLDQLLDDYAIDVAVLARFMQIIPDHLCRKWSGKIINIHHSFLPSFAGAKPYRQAYDRGVKLIGATCHYVTSTLDEGPIIEQQVIPISHSDTVEDMVRKGKDCEKTALANGFLAHLDDRVFIDGNKTVVFA